MYISDTSIFQKSSDSHSADQRHIPIPVRELSAAVSSLLEHKFKGLAEAELTPTDEEFILISPEQLAYFLTALLKIIDGRVYLNVRLLCTGMDFVLEVKPSELVELDLSDQAFLCSAAAAAGFDIEITKDAILLRTELERAGSHIQTVYEKPDLDLSLLFESLFSE